MTEVQLTITQYGNLTIQVYDYTTQLKNKAKNKPNRYNTLNRRYPLGKILFSNKKTQKHSDKRKYNKHGY